MLIERDVTRRTELAATSPSERVEALLGLLLVPFAVLLGVVAGAWRFLRGAKPLATQSAPAIDESSEPLRDVAAFAEKAECEECDVRRGFGALDFELSYAGDIVPSSLDAYPALANRYFHCPPPFRRVTFESLDGTPLAAEVATHDGGARPGLVVVHGTFGSSGQAIYSTPAIRAFEEWGFNVAVVDLRGWGRSSALSKAPMTGGWREAEDVLAAAQYLLENTDTTTVGAMGYSLGGASVMLAAAHDRAPELLASGVFSESGYVDAADVIRIVERNPGMLARKYVPYWLFKLGLGRKFAIQGHRRVNLIEYFERVSARYYGVSVEELFRHDSVLEAVGRIRVPLFHLHAVDDWIVPVEHAYWLRDAAERAGNRLVGVCVRSRGAHCAFDRVSGEWRRRIAHEFFTATSRPAP